MEVPPQTHMMAVYTARSIMETRKSLRLAIRSQSYVLSSLKLRIWERRAEVTRSECILDHVTTSAWA